MSCEAGGSPQEPERKGVNVYRANRELERWLFHGQSFDDLRHNPPSRQAPSFDQMMATRGIAMILHEGKCYDLQDDGSYKAEDGEILSGVQTAPKSSS